MKATIILPIAGFCNFQLSAMLPGKCCVHSNPGLIIHGVNKLNTISARGKTLSYKIGN
jgi:hypothetical protein